MNQKERLLNYLQNNRSITSLEALTELGIFRAPNRISELRKEGHIISGRNKTVRNRFNEKCGVKEYTLGEFL
jgi:biotin operon repressor